ncbi:MAG: Response regulator receiver and domain protein [Acidimicrobiales bacterium]|nr:Response regulator receiver and domain protein [Acidimicrobiales bacterium]
MAGLTAGGASSPLASRLVTLAEGLRAVSSPAEAYGRVAATAVEVVRGCEYSAVTVSERRRPAVAAASDAIALALDLLQHEVGEGPCLEALGTAAVVGAEDLGDDGRWPSFTSRALVESPVRAVLSQPLVIDGRTVGALNLYARRVAAFDPSDRETSSVLAGYAAVALANVEEILQLREALASRDVISTAKGLLMGRQRLSEQEAFDVLRRASRRSNVKVRELARTIVTRAADASLNLPRDSRSLPG